ncbi:MAG TPA: Fn3-like domain-containing protein [Thermoanaerobaculia bacterium]|nr:Fn3-like domain-containing protein [Thermoanaerobaculia bacterium]
MLRKFAFLLTALCALPAVMHAAATTGTISVSPAVVMLRGVAGQSTTQTLTVTNGSTQPFSFEMQANDVVVENGQRRFSPAGQIAGSIAGTAAFSQKLVTVAPGDTKQIDVTVTIPSNPASRAVVALFHGTNKLEKNGFNMTASVGTLMTFTLSDDVAMEAQPLAVTPPSGSANLTVAQECTNSGREPIVAKGMLAIVGGSGNLVGKTALPARRLLPGEKTDIRAEYGGDLAPGHYRALVTYDVESKLVTSSAEFDVR